MADKTVEQLVQIAGAGGIQFGDLFYVFRPGVPDLDFQADVDDIQTYIQDNITANITNVAALPYTISLAETTLNVKVPGTISMPASPIDGQTHHIRLHFHGTLIIDGNGNPINNSDTVFLDTKYQVLTLQYNASDGEWMVI